MLVTVTNTSGGDLNALDEIDLGSSGTSGGTATGGARKDPLPYPFGHIGTLGDTLTSVLPMRERDFTHKAVPWLPMEPAQEWQTLIQAGKVTFAIAAESILAATQDAEEDYIGTVASL
jgi:hypothetical protein